MRTARTQFHVRLNDVSPYLFALGRSTPYAPFCYRLRGGPAFSRRFADFVQVISTVSGIVVLAGAAVAEQDLLDLCFKIRFERDTIASQPC